MHELAGYYNRFELDTQLPERLVYGSYPEVVTLTGNSAREEYLRDIASSYVYKDILELEQIKYSFKIRDLLKLPAFQVGSQVSIHVLCQKLGLNRDTVERYLDLLEQSFVIFRLPALSRNPRKEISKSLNKWFWRTYTGIEIDYIEESDGAICSYEIKYSKAGRSGPPKSCSEQYGGPYQTINRENYPDFILTNPDYTGGSRSVRSGLFSM